MKVTLLLPELKVFTRAVSALGKLGDELYFECGDGELSLRCVNSSRSAFAVAFFSESFFEKCADLDGSGSNPLFKLTSRTCCKVFKQTFSWDKMVQKCRLNLDESKNTLIVQFFQRHGIVKTYNLPIIDCESLEAVYDINDAVNHLSISSKVVGEIFNNFRVNQSEVTMALRDGECIFRNYVDDSDLSAVITHVPVSSSEFETYNLTEESDITFCQKDIRVAIAFGESVNSSMVIHCSQSGKPLILTFMQDNRFKAHFILATLRSTGTPKKTNLENNTVSSINATSVSKSCNIPSSHFSRNSQSISASKTQQPFAGTQEVLPTADTQILPTTPLPSRPQLTATTPLPILCENDSDLPVKKGRSVLFSAVKRARSVLFSRLEDNFFENLPPAQPPVILDPFEDEEDMENLSKTMLGDVGYQNIDPPVSAVERRKQLIVPVAAGWSIGDQTCMRLEGRTSNVTLLVADSDED